MGKSQTALKVSEFFPSEIISADSHQVYKYMDIGTAKPSLSDRQKVPHHIIDIIYPDESFSLAEFQEHAYSSIEQVLGNSRLPLLVGGSGQYVRSIIEGWQVPRVKPDPGYREELERLAANGGTELLYDKLKKADPEASKRVDPRNTRRLIRALEIARQGGMQHAASAPRYKVLIIGLTAPRKKLYHMVDNRVDAMIEAGFVQEVENLFKKGYNFNLPSMRSIGYRQLGLYLKGETDLGEAVERIKHENHRLIRTQYNWFSPDDQRINWFDITKDNYMEAIISKIEEFNNS